MSANLDDQKIKTMRKLQMALEKEDVPKVQPMLAVDFSLSAKWNGVHGEKRWVQRFLEVLELTKARFFAQAAIPVFRFGCKLSEELRCVPLNAEDSQEYKYSDFSQIAAAYETVAARDVFYGPSGLAAVIRRAVQFSQQEAAGKVVVCIILTDGRLEDLKGDCEALVEASKCAPVCFVGVGLGSDIDCGAMEHFDDLKGRKFDNFQFVNFTTLKGFAPGTRCERPDLAAALALFNELPAAYTKIRKAGLLEK